MPEVPLLCLFSGQGAGHGNLAAQNLRHEIARDGLRGEPDLFEDLAA